MYIYDLLHKVFDAVESAIKVKIVGGGGGTDPVGLKNTGGTPVNPATEDKQDDAISELQKLTGFEIPVHDYISLSYTGDNLTGVVFKEGGSGGSTVAALTLGYTGDNLTSVTKT